MNIYGPEYMDIYYDKQLYSMPPHIFAIADSAYRETFVKNNNSCIIITGLLKNNLPSIPTSLKLISRRKWKWKNRGLQTFTSVHNKHFSQTRTVYIEKNHQVILFSAPIGTIIKFYFWKFIVASRIRYFIRTVSWNHLAMLEPSVISTLAVLVNTLKSAFQVKNV